MSTDLGQLAADLFGVPMSTWADPQVKLDPKLDLGDGAIIPLNFRRSHSEFPTYRVQLVSLRVSGHLYATILSHPEDDETHLVLYDVGPAKARNVQIFAEFARTAKDIESWLDYVEWLDTLGLFHSAYERVDGKWETVAIVEA